MESIIGDQSTVIFGKLQGALESGSGISINSMIQR